MLRSLAPEPFAREMRDRFGAFLDERVSPGAAERDRACRPISRELLREAGDLGLLGFTMPAAVGGGGRTRREWGLVLHEIGYRCDDTSFPMLLAYCATVTKMLHETGRSDLLSRYVAPMVRGERLGGFGWSEGHDPFSFETIARPCDPSQPSPSGSAAGDYVLSGEKVPIANGLIGDVFMIFAKHAVTGDVVCLLVERDDPGVEITPYAAVGLRAAGMARVRLRDVRVPGWRVLRDCDALSYGQRFLNDRRLEMPCWALGRMRAMFETCARDLGKRVRYGLPLTEMQTIQAAFGRMFIGLEASRLVVQATLEGAEGDAFDPLWHPLLAVGKSVVVEHALAMCRTVQDITGGAGVFDLGPYERTIRDLQCLNPIAGTLMTLQVDLGILALAEVRRASRRNDLGSMVRETLDRGESR